ncbi:MAG: PepSY-associated TM helix domain-containing protein [Opitutaceae bacterium]|nr:PepSY-associated TM helix domain-containing protein [Opitutaceae bacterium]
MKNWNLIFRRTHLYLGMLLIPWVLVFALSTFVYNHPGLFAKFRPADPQWVRLWEKDYEADVPAENESSLRGTASRILADHGMSGAFAARRQGPRLNISVLNFLHPRRLTYDFTTKKLRAEEKKFAWVEVLIRLHERTGYGRGGLLASLWAVAVDVFCVTTLIWIATGIYLWWKLAAVRRWGFIALAAGFTTIVALALTL